jgi:hypothetical protein
VVRGNLVASLTIAVVIVLSALLVLFAMIIPALPSLRATSPALAALGSAYFLLIGLGFMFVEIGLIERISVFLGHPVYGLAIALFGIIVATGIGSLMSGKGLRSRPAIIIWGSLLGLYLICLPLWLPRMVLAFEGHSLLVRAVVALLAIVPAGVLMGFGFPTGLQLVNTLDVHPTPWFWAINGAAGVLAASLAVVMSISLSINTTLWTGAGCYIVLCMVGSALISLQRTFAKPTGNSVSLA